MTTDLRVTAAAVQTAMMSVARTVSQEEGRLRTLVRALDQSTDPLPPELVEGLDAVDHIVQELVAWQNATDALLGAVRAEHPTREG